MERVVEMGEMKGPSLRRLFNEDFVSAASYLTVWTATLPSGQERIGISGSDSCQNHQTNTLFSNYLVSSVLSGKVAHEPMPNYTL